MKYLKEYNQNNWWEEITEDEFKDKTFKDIYLFSFSEIDKIKSFCHQFGNFKFEVLKAFLSREREVINIDEEDGTSSSSREVIIRDGDRRIVYTPDNLRINVVLYRFSIRIILDGLNIFINRDEDEWYYVWTSGYGSYIKIYKCDQLEGLERFILFMVDKIRN